MGMDLHTYLGPYVEYTPNARPHEVTVYGCADPGCSQYKNRSPDAKRASRFCADCGKPTGPSTRTETRTLRYFDVLDSERLTSLKGEGDDCNEGYLGCNIAAPYVFHFREDGSEHLPITPASINEEIAWFVKTFALELEMLRAAYGPEHVKVLWGLHQYWM